MSADLLANISNGLSVAFQLENLLYCMLGVTLGTALGMLPGIGVLMALSLLYPLTFYLSPAAGLIMLAGVYYGTAYGGAISCILLNLPGTPSHTVTCLDGYPMAQQGRAGPALFMTAAASFCGGSAGIILLMVSAPIIVSWASNFGPREMFGLMVLGLTSAATMGAGSAAKGLAMAAMGILIGLIGGDLFTGMPRFTFGSMNLYDGLNLLVMAMGIFGVAEVSANVGNAMQSTQPKFDTSLRAMIPTREDVRRSWKAILRGGGIGAFFGVIPGTGPLIASFVAYSAEKSASKEPWRFGKGAIEGLAAPEAANNAAEQTSFIPTLALGIPGSAAMAIMLSVFLIHGITPGPGLLSDHGDIVWGLIMSFWIGNVLLVALNIPMIGVWVRLLSVPYHYLFPCILVFICLGVYSIHNSSFDIWMVLVFSVVGFGMRQLDLPAAPMLLGFILGPMIEEHFRRSMLIARGDLTTFFQTPLSAILMSCVFLIFLWRGSRMVLRWRTGSSEA